MGLADKMKSSKDNRLKLKFQRLRLGNVKDFHGKRQHGTDNLEKSISEEKPKKEKKPLLSTLVSKSTLPPNYFSRQSISTAFPPLPNYSEKTVLSTSANTENTCSSAVDIDPTTSQPKQRFEDHMARWADEFRTPLTTHSRNVEFEMPYCYSEEFYKKLSAKCMMLQPFSSVGEPLGVAATWNSHVFDWYEKAQMALQFYRHLCGQPSRMPLQTLTIKRSVARFVAEHSALLGTELYFEAFLNSGIRMDIVFQESNDSALFMVPEPKNLLLPTECSGIQFKTESSIYTSSWKTSF